MPIFNEELMQFVWQHRYFSQQELYLTTGESIKIVSPGQRNTNQGPDFLHARIKINDTLWVGNIEVDMYASNWYKHQHNNNPHYANTILHIVGYADVLISHNNQPLSTLELNNNIPSLLLDRFNYLMAQPNRLPCAYAVQQVPTLVWQAWKDRLLIERLQSKTKAIEQILYETKRDWETCLWWLMARHFGQTVNASSFEQIARSITLSIINKHKNQPNQLESILFGQAGLLDKNFKEDYPVMLKKEYNYLKQKYNLQMPKIVLHFLRMRPLNFPTIRLAQLSMLLHKASHLFSIIIEADDLKKVTSILQITASDYWNNHYQLDTPTTYQPKKIGKDMIDRLVINVIAPMLFAYGHIQKNDHLIEKAIHWLQKIAIEKNVITVNWERTGVNIQHAADSQALITLYNDYCEKKRCLQCVIGHAILKKEPG